jgi:protein O-mannosyl-transferase
MNQRLYYFSAILFIWIISFLTYYSSLSNEFLLSWDDGSYILKNQHLHTINLESIWWMLTVFHAANWHPLTWFSHAVDYALFGKNAWGHHLTSVIFHAFNSVWVFLLSIVLIYIVEKSSLEVFKFKEIFQLKRFFVALLTAILFAIHPQHVESVAWISERKDVLFFFFFIPALLSYAIYTQTTEKRWYILSLVCFVLSLLSKPMAITLPVILILFDVYPLKQIDLKSINYKKWFINKIPFFLIALMTGIFTLLAQADGGAVASVQQVGLVPRILNAFNSLVAYFGKWLLPLHLSPFYQLQVQDLYKGIQGYSFSLVAMGVVIVTTVISIYFWMKSQKAWLVGWLFYIITLLPVLGLIQVGSQGMADRYAYLTTLPFYLLLSIGLISLYLKYSKIISVLLIFSISGLLITLTQDQIKIWRNDFTLWDYVVRSNPDSALAQGLLGTVYMRLGEYEKASKHFEFSVGLAGTSGLTHFELGGAYFNLGRMDDALKEFQTAIVLDNAPKKTKADTYFNIALIYLEKKDSLQAIEALEQALKIVPDHPDALALKKDLQK